MWVNKQKHTAMENTQATQTEPKKGMTKEQILDAIKSLAMSQGFYGRLLRSINENPAILDELESQHFSDSLDMVMYLEC
jgi:hypothetical protein